jgi:hypothetical protein
VPREDHNITLQTADMNYLETVALFRPPEKYQIRTQLKVKNIKWWKKSDGV